MDTVSPLRQRRFEELYERHMLEVLAYCMRRLGRTNAADACSETFLIAWRRLDDLPEPPQTLPYLYGIARRVASNQARSLRRRSRLDARLTALGVSTAPDPELLVAQSNRDQEIVAAVRRLKPKDREIVMLYAWEDLPRDTIAEMMGMTRSAIDQRIHRANKRLARILQPDSYPTPPLAQEGGT
ncbi:MAG TPA: sigma-70 family RNA polymerase sigma factor [Acidimicrobiia bacterium]|nr:sigma-70 family RNA polymerase sigma factor [Acidimicrobiia bacterium]